jgi:hypothetical protein
MKFVVPSNQLYVHIFWLGTLWATFFVVIRGADWRSDGMGLRRKKIWPSKFWIFQQKPNFFDVFHWQNPPTPIYKNDHRCFLYSTTPRSRLQLFLVKSYDFLDVELYFFNFFKLKTRVKNYFFQSDFKIFYVFMMHFTSTFIFKRPKFLVSVPYFGSNSRDILS